MPDATERHLPDDELKRLYRVAHTALDLGCRFFDVISNTTHERNL